MEHFKRMAIFAEVVAANSFSAAARRLNMTPSAVSQHVRQLEQSLGLALLHRSTRQLSLTEAGQRYLEGCNAMVAAARSAEEALARLRDEPEGELRLAAPAGFGNILAQALLPLRQHPKLGLQLLLDDAMIDLIEARVDVAIRVGKLSDSNWVARQLGSIQHQLCASAEYLSTRGWPAHPRDLAQHDWIGHRARTLGGEVLELIGQNGEREIVQVEARVQVSHVVALSALCIAGWGISVGVDHQAMAEGRLLPILPGWHMAVVPVYAVTQRRKQQPAKVRHVLELLTAFFADPVQGRLHGLRLGPTHKHL